MPKPTPDGLAAIERIAERHDVSTDAVMALVRALGRGGGQQAQFSHSELGGMGQWSPRGMIMIGDMFNSALRAKVDAMCIEVADLIRDETLFEPDPRGTDAWSASGDAWWPSDCGTPSATGSQNDMRYACFPDTRRVAIQQGDEVCVYDSGDHRIHGVSQQQGSSQDLTFTSQNGTVRLHELSRIAGGPASPPRPAEPRRAASSPGEPPPSPRGETPGGAPPVATHDGILATIERLHALQQKGILSDTEFAEKKKELLARL